jgi:hypothetical protein
LDKKKEVRTIMQDVTVLAVGQNIVDTIPAQLEEGSKDSFLINNLRKVYNFTSVTIEVSPSEVQLLIHILNVNPGALYATLRNPNDRYVNPLKVVDADDVLGKVKSTRLPAEDIKPPVPAPKQPQPGKKAGAYEEL